MPAGPVCVLAPDAALGEALVAALQSRGIDAEANRPYETAQTVLIGAALGEGSPQDLYWPVFEAAREARTAGVRDLIILQDAGGAFRYGEDGGWRGGVAGLARTARREWPEMTIRLVDLPASRLSCEESSAALIRALSTGASDVAMDPQRGPVAPSYQPAPAPRDVPSSGRASVWVVSGGARGVTPDCVIALAQRSGGHFALLGRSQVTPWPVGIPDTDEIGQLRKGLAQGAIARGEKPRPADVDTVARQAMGGREIRATVAAIRAAGGEAAYFSCDIADPDAVATAIGEVEAQFGQVTGLIHGAGVLADGWITDKTRDDFEKVYRTKVGGLQALLGAVERRRLTHIALFSSAAAQFGNPGQSDYAVANEVLNRVAHKLKADMPQVRVKSFNWGPWDGGMVTDAHASHFRALGVPLIPRKAGAEVFAEQLLCGGRDSVELVIGEPWKA